MWIFEIKKEEKCLKAFHNDVNYCVYLEQKEIWSETKISLIERKEDWEHQNRWICLLQRLRC